MKTSYISTPVICKYCQYKVTIETDYISRNLDGLKEDIKLVCPKCGGIFFKKVLK
jgi:DNA-directed RNA polymerase subunit RPC12/RpoP